jgi:hypothetical protein
MFDGMNIKLSMHVGKKKSPIKRGKNKSSPVKAKRKLTSTKRTPTKKDSKKVLDMWFLPRRVYMEHVTGFID